MNKLKKLLILVLSFLAISSFAFGCGSGEKTSNSNNSSVLSTQSSSSEISSEQSSSSVEQSSSSSTQTTLSYRVEYYLKNLNDNDYTLEESLTENLTGIEGSIVYATIKDIKGFASESSSVSSCLEEGMVLKVYYSRERYTVTLKNENSFHGTNMGGGTYLFGESIEIKATSKSGYSFAGWYSSNRLVSNLESFSFIIEENVEFLSKWTARTDVPYKIEYYLQKGNSYELESSLTENLTGTTGTTVFAIIKNIMGYTVENNNVYGTVNGEGKTVLRVYYSINSYQISLINENNLCGEISGEGDYLYNQNVTITATSKTGYLFKGWYTDSYLLSEESTFTFSATKDLEITAKWQPMTNIPYKVEYYFENLDGGGYTLDHSLTENLLGTAGTNVKAQIKIVRGFNATNQKVEEPLDVNGETVLKVYYNRVLCSITLNSNGNGTVTGGGTFVFGSQIEIKANPQQGYKFEGWKKGIDVVFISEQEKYLFIVEENLTLTAVFKERTDTPYIVEYYLQNLNGQGYSIDENLTERLTGKTNSIVYADIKKIQGFTAESNNVNKPLLGSGETILKVYYSRNKYTVTITNEKPLCGSVSQEGESLVFYGTNKTITATENSGYYFIGWFENNLLISEQTTYEFTIEKTTQIIAKWGACSNIPYRVEYYFQNIENFNEYLIEESLTQTPTGKTGEVVSATINEVEGYEATQTTVSDILNANGSTVLKIYYDIKEVFYINSGVVINLTTYGETLKNIVIPTKINGQRITEIDSWAFSQCENIEEVTIADSVLTIGAKAFNKCTKLTKINGGSGVKTIEDSAFRNCTSLENIVVPNSVEKMEDSIFQGCINLKSLTIPFVGVSSTATVADTTTLFGYIFGQFSYDGGVETKQYYSDRRSVTYYIPSSLKTVTVTGGKILYGAFYNCSSITDINLPNDLTEIGDWDFYNCTNLKEVSLPDSVEQVGDWAFCGCTSLTYVFGRNLKSIGENAFASCFSLTSITISSKVEEIKAHAFYLCSSLASVTFENTSGWFVTQESGATSGTEIDVTKLDINATNLKETYSSYYWKRNA